jgi:hypothetical protein
MFLSRPLLRTEAITEIYNGYLQRMLSMSIREIAEKWLPVRRR